MQLVARMHGRSWYARSTDLMHWQRDDARAGIDVSDTGWDSEMVSYPHVFELDGTTWMMYLGNQVGRHGFGLARLGLSVSDSRAMKRRIIVSLVFVLAIALCGGLVWFNFFRDRMIADVPLGAR